MIATSTRKVYALYSPGEYSRCLEYKGLLFQLMSCFLVSRFGFSKSRRTYIYVVSLRLIHPIIYMSASSPQLINVTVSGCPQFHIMTVASPPAHNDTFRRSQPASPPTCIAVSGALTCQEATTSEVRPWRLAWDVMPVLLPAHNLILPCPLVLAG